MCTLCAQIWSRPRALVCVFGGAGGLHHMLVPNLKALITHGAVVAAAGVGGIVLDGGTDFGVMQMVGQAVGRTRKRTVRVIGCCPDGERPTQTPCPTPLLFRC